MVTWAYTITPRDLRLGVGAALWRYLRGLRVQQWGAYRRGRLVLALAHQATHGAQDWLYLAAPSSGPEVEALRALLAQVRLTWREAWLDYPAQAPSTPFQEAGLQLHRELIWMRWQGVAH